MRLDVMTVPCAGCHAEAGQPCQLRLPWDPLVGICDRQAAQVADLDAAKGDTAVEGEIRREAAAEVVARIRHCADVIDADEVSRTARTLNRIALVIEAEFVVRAGKRA